MKIVFSRKGFDSASGRGPSPIVHGRAISLPIPEKPQPQGNWTTYADRKLDHLLATGHKEPKCHDDPMFHNGFCWFGQCSAAQSHLMNQKIGPEDIFLFFGLFQAPGELNPHHRIFGYMKVTGRTTPDERHSAEGWRDPPNDRPHPHADESYRRYANNCIWYGPGRNNAPSSELLRLTAPGKSPSVWKPPVWLRNLALSYHGKPNRWQDDGTLQTVGRGQEFVCDISGNSDAQDWRDRVIAEIERR